MLLLVNNWKREKARGVVLENSCCGDFQLHSSQITFVATHQCFLFYSAFLFLQVFLCALFTWYFHSAAHCVAQKQDYLLWCFACIGNWCTILFIIFCECFVAYLYSSNVFKLTIQHTVSIDWVTIGISMLYWSHLWTDLLCGGSSTYKDNRDDSADRLQSMYL